jgi:ATP-dependent Zn protease
MTTRALRATAFHEAGHAVMAYLQRVPFRQVSIVPDADTLGHVLFGGWPEWANPDSGDYRERAAYDYFMRRARVSLAGQIAEGHHLGKPPRSGMYSDNCQVADRALHLCLGVEDTANAMLEWLYLDTRDRLTSPLVWPAVERLADALV